MSGYLEQEEARLRDVIIEDQKSDIKLLRDNLNNTQTVMASLMAEFDEYKKNTCAEAETKHWRRVYAGQALQGILACPIEFTGRETYEGRAVMAVQHADELLKKLEK